MAFSYKKQTHGSKGKAGKIRHPVGASPHSGARKNKLTAAFKAREDKVRPRKKKAPKIPTIKARSGPTKRRPTMKEQLKDSGVGIDYDQLDKMKYGGKITKKSHGGRTSPVTGKADGPYKVLPSEEVPIMPKPPMPKPPKSKKKTKPKKPSKPESLLPKKMGGGKVINKRSGGSMKKGLNKASKSLKNRESKVKRSTLKELGDKYMDPLGLRNLKKLEKMIDERNMTPKPKKKRKPFDPYETMEAKAGGKVLYKKHGGKVNKEATSGDDLISSCYD